MQSARISRCAAVEQDCILIMLYGLWSDHVAKILTVCVISKLYAYFFTIYDINTRHGRLFDPYPLHIIPYVRLVGRGLQPLAVEGKRGSCRNRQRQSE